VVAVEVRNVEFLTPAFVAVLKAAGAALPVYVTINNKAEGSAPLSVLELASEIASVYRPPATS
jgi:uncharacterized protein YecE (DUF72 family)